MSDLAPYRAGDVLTCSSDGYPAPTYRWTVDGVTSSTESTLQALQEGEHVYECTASVTFDGTTCFATSTSTVIAYSKYRKQYNTLLTILMLMALSVG